MAGPMRSSGQGDLIGMISTLPAKADAIAVAIFEKTAALPGHMKGIDAAVDGALSRAIALGDFKAKVGTVVSGGACRGYQAIAGGRFGEAGEF